MIPEPPLEIRTLLLPSIRDGGEPMSKKGRTYSPEFKKEAVELVRRTGLSANQMAKDLGIS